MVRWLQLVQAVASVSFGICLEVIARICSSDQIFSHILPMSSNAYLVRIQGTTMIAFYDSQCLIPPQALRDHVGRFHSEGLVNRQPARGKDVSRPSTMGLGRCLLGGFRIFIDWRFWQEGLPLGFIARWSSAPVWWLPQTNLMYSFEWYARLKSCK